MIRAWARRALLAFTPAITFANLSASADIAGSFDMLTANPCRNALRLALPLPAADRGPQLRAALLLLETILRLDAIAGARPEMCFSRVRLAGREQVGPRLT